MLLISPLCFKQQTYRYFKKKKKKVVKTRLKARQKNVMLQSSIVSRQCVIWPGKILCLVSKKKFGNASRRAQKQSTSTQNDADIRRCIITGRG